MGEVVGGGGDLMEGEPFLEEQFPCSSFDLGLTDFIENTGTFQEPVLEQVESSLEQTLYMNQMEQCF